MPRADIKDACLPDPATDPSLDSQRRNKSKLCYREDEVSHPLSSKPSAFGMSACLVLFPREKKRDIRIVPITRNSIRIIPISYERIRMTIILPRTRDIHHDIHAHSQLDGVD